MKQNYHSNATTNIHLREIIHNSDLTNKALASQYNISVKTVAKWKERSCLTDKSSRPENIAYSLSDLSMLVAVEIRSMTWLPLDEITEIINPVAPASIRSAIYRAFLRKEINTVPIKEKEKAKKFKEYDPGFLHIDVTYLPKIDGVKYYLFVAIDRATRVLYYKIYEAKTSVNAESFMLECLEFFPFGITHVLTDNGVEFTNRLIKNKKGEYCTTPRKLDVVCQENNIDHRCTKPFTPKTNGMVEKANDTIKRATIKVKKYNSLSDMNRHLISFLITYNLYRRHGSLRKELNVKTPLNAVEKWYELDPEIFTEKPIDFEQKILNLKIN
jgi:transposase-like protein